MHAEFWIWKLTPSPSFVHNVIFSKKRYFVYFDIKFGDDSYCYKLGHIIIKNKKVKNGQWSNSKLLRL